MTPAPAATARDGLPVPQRHGSTLTILTGIALTVIDSTMMGLALPDIARDLRASPAEVIGVVNAYQIAILALLLPMAAVADRLGARRVYLAGMTVFGIASVACWFAPNLSALVAARALQGVGGAGVFACNTALVRATYPQALLGRGIALNSVVVAASSVAGPPLAALLLSIGSWHWLFAINVPLALLILALGWHHLPAARGNAGPAARLSAVDVLLNAVMFTTAFLGVDGLLPRADVAPHTGSALALLVLAALIGAVYVRRQRREAVPLLPLDLLRRPVFRLTVMTSVGSFSAYTLCGIALPFLLLGEMQYSHAQTGLVLAASPLATIVAAPLAGRLIGRVADGLLAGAGLFTMALGFGALALLPDHAAMADVAWRLALCGIGFGLFQSPNNHALVVAAPAHRTAAVGGTMASARLTGETLGALLLALLFSWPGLPHGTASLVALGGSAAFAAAAGGISLLRLRAAAPSAR